MRTGFGFGLGIFLAAAGTLAADPARPLTITSGYNADTLLSSGLAICGMLALAVAAGRKFFKN